MARMTKARKQRIQEARAWYPKQHFTEDSHVIKAYRDRFGVNKVCAMRELCLLGTLSPERQQVFEEQLQRREQRLAKKRERRRWQKANQTQRELGDIESLWDWDYYFVAGHTSGGVPYGTTWEEAEDLGLVERSDA